MTRSLLLSLLVAGCATVPKPPELEAFERLKALPAVPAAQKRSPDLVSASDGLYLLAKKEWQGKDLDESRRDSLLGAIKLKLAMALAEQDQAKARIAAATAETAKVDEEYARLAKDLGALNEQIALMVKLGEARSAAAHDKAKLSQQLSEEQQRAAARDKVAAAELAIKTADIVDAANNAKTEYASASDSLQRAQGELKDGKWSAAQASAEMAKSKAEQAALISKPIFERSEQHRSDKTRDEQLGRDAAAINGITVRLERRGEVQRLVLPLSGLFAKKSTVLVSGKDDVIDAVAKLMKKYPSYPIHVVGHVARVGKAGELFALSQARAQAVSTALVNHGIEDRRLKVTGMGADEPLSDGKGAAKELNNRVEIIFIYQ
jgi:outer membrane protein OmpA-like peptidoglycan-associated protein